MKNFIKIIFLVLLLILFSVPTVLPATTHEFRTTIDASGAYRINTVPEKVWKDPRFQKLLGMGLPQFIMAKEDNVWDEKPIIGGYYEDIELYLDRLGVLTYFLDKYAGIDFMVVVYYPSMNDALIYLHVDEWTNKKVHDDLVKQLNRARQFRLEPFNDIR